MTIKTILKEHTLWLQGIGGSRANLRDADLRGANLSDADLRDADLRGADLNWNSHELISTILLQAALDNPKKRMIAGLISISTDWCWKDFLRIEVPYKSWAIKELRKWVQDVDNAPAMIVVGK